jgi:hypothetical protein
MDFLDHPAVALAPADAFSDEDRLAVRMRVPGGAGAEREASRNRVAVAV